MGKLLLPHVQVLVLHACILSAASRCVFACRLDVRLLVLYASPACKYTIPLSGGALTTSFAWIACVHIDCIQDAAVRQEIAEGSDPSRTYLTQENGESYGRVPLRH